MLLRQAFVFFIFVFITFSDFVVGEHFEGSSLKNCTVLLPRLKNFKHNILTRRKRVVIFPKKAFVLISQAFTKAIIDGRPPGLSYSIEFDMYSSLPDSVEAWQPTILNQKLKNEQTKAPEPAPPPAPTPISTTNANSTPISEANLEHDIHNFSFEKWSDYDEPPFQHEYDEFATDDINRNWHPFDSLKQRYKKQKLSQQKQMKKLYKQHLWNRPDNGKIENEFSNRAESIRHWPPLEDVYESEAHVPVWKYHQAYRERRALFEQLETLGKIFNFDMKACVQRVMCEISSKLRPFGEFLMEDIVRIIFTLPKKLHFHDDYSYDFGQRTERKTNCAQHFKDGCPYRVLDFITNTMKTMKTMKFDSVRQENLSGP